MEIDPKAEETTRERILRHAIARFSAKSYDNTGLREIAADAGVDVAWVHRSFGSKEQLFSESVQAAIRIDDALTDLGPQTIGRLLNEVLCPMEDGDTPSIDIIAHSFSSSDAARVIREIATSRVIDPLSKVLPPGSELNIAISLSTLIGFAIMRDIVGITALTQAQPEDLKPILSRVVAALSPAEIT
jgi:AcrR family transcriptional regulator